jgi:RNA polymerase sigma factor (sigma-70 family)
MGAREELIAKIEQDIKEARQCLENFLSRKTSFCPFQTDDGKNPLAVARRKPRQQIEGVIQFPEGKKITAVVCYYPPEVKTQREDAQSKSGSRSEAAATELAASSKDSSDLGNIPEEGDYFIQLPGQRKPRQALLTNTETGSQSFSPVHNSGRAVPVSEEAKDDFVDIEAKCELEFGTEEKGDTPAVAESFTEPDFSQHGARVRARDEDEWRCLTDLDYCIGRLWGTVFQSVRQRVAQQADAEDITQETFVEWCRTGRINFDPSKGTVATNLWGIARYKCFEFFRETKRAKKFGALSGVSIHQTNSAGQSSLAERIEAVTVPCSTEVQERDSLIRSVINNLTEEHAEVLLLRHYEDMSYGSIAEKLAISVGTVRSRLSRARENFMEAWNQVDPK